MRATLRIATVALVLSAVMLVGCAHKVELNVTNATNKSFPVKVAGPGIGVMKLTTLGPYDNQTHELKFKKKELPATVKLDVGDFSTSFTVGKDGPKVFRYDVTVDGRFRSRGEGPVTDERKIDISVPLTEPVEVVD